LSNTDKAQISLRQSDKRNAFFPKLCIQRELTLPTQIPIIDISCLRDKERNQAIITSMAEALHRACTEHGFFYVSGHGVDAMLMKRLEELSRQFFALPEEQKMRISMALGGKPWRGYFPVGGELTSGIPDLKEGIYFGVMDIFDAPLGWVPSNGQN
jgi:isopenicillin N synthase-like dioxygenase